MKTTMMLAKDILADIIEGDGELMAWLRDKTLEHELVVLKSCVVEGLEHTDPAASGSRRCTLWTLQTPSRCRWVLGVAGNHDVFGPGWSGPRLESFKKEDGIVFLDDGKITLDSLTVAGLSGTIGNQSCRSPRCSVSSRQRPTDDYAVARPCSLAKKDRPQVMDHVQHHAVRAYVAKSPQNQPNLPVGQPTLIRSFCNGHRG